MQRRATKSIQVLARDTCRACGNPCSAVPDTTSQRTVIDILPTIRGIKKVITAYTLEHVYCPVCKKVYTHGPQDALKGNQLYGYGFKAWVIYQRVALRLPYNSILESLWEQFNEKINMSSIPTVSLDVISLAASS